MLEDIVNGKIVPEEKNGKYVILTQTVDLIHGLPEGATLKRFKEIKKTLTDEDYFSSNRPIFRDKKSINHPVWLTASGYLKLTDDKDIQGVMFNYFFSGKSQSQIKSSDWKDEINSLLNTIKYASGFDHLKILSCTYKEISDTYNINLNVYKNKYLKENPSLDDVSTLDVVHWLEITDVIPNETLKKILERVKANALNSK